MKIIVEMVESDRYRITPHEETMQVLPTPFMAWLVDGSGRLSDACTLAYCDLGYLAGVVAMKFAQFKGDNFMLRKVDTMIQRTLKLMDTLDVADVQKAVYIPGETEQDLINAKQEIEAYIAETSPEMEVTCSIAGDPGDMMLIVLPPAHIPLGALYLLVASIEIMPPRHHNGLSV